MANWLTKLFGWSGKAPPVSRDASSKDKGGEANQLSPYDSYLNSIKAPYERRRRYDVYDEMDEMGLPGSILDAYAEDSTQTDREHSSAIWIEAKDAKVQKELDALRQRLRWDDYVEAIARDTGKQGDDYAQLLIEGTEIIGWDWKDPRDLERIESKEGILIGFEETEKLKALSSKPPDEQKQHEYTYKPWDVIHFRLYKTKREKRQKFRNLYGTSLFARADRLAKQNKILDDLLMVRRLTKTLDTRVYEIDTGRSSVEEEVMILKRWRNALKRKPYIDVSAGRFDSNFDPTSFQEDIFWPKREGSESSVTNIAGQSNVADIVDVDHFINQFFGAMRAPKGYFGFEGDIEAKATLSAQDMKWGRACNSLQQAVKNGFFRLCQIQLALKGIDPYSEFSVEMVVPSVLEDLSRLEAYQILIDVAERMMSLGESMELDVGKWREHILRKVLGMSDGDIKRFASTPPPEDMEPPDNDDKDDDEPDEQKEVEALREVILNRMRLPTAGVQVTENARREELPEYDGALKLADLANLEIPGSLDD